MDQIDIDEAIETAATSPQSVTTEAASVSMPSVSDLIELDKHEASKRAVTSAFPLRGTLARFGGTGAQ